MEDNNLRPSDEEEQRIVDMINDLNINHQDIEPYIKKTYYLDIEKRQQIKKQMLMIGIQCQHQTEPSFLLNLVLKYQKFLLEEDQFFNECDDDRKKLFFSKIVDIFIKIIKKDQALFSSRMKSWLGRLCFASLIAWNKIGHFYNIVVVIAKKTLNALIQVTKAVCIGSILGGMLYVSFSTIMSVSPTMPQIGLAVLGISIVCVGVYYIIKQLKE